MFSSTAIGEIAALTSAACWAVATILFARLGASIAPLALNALKCAIALLLLVPTVLIFGKEQAAIPAPNLSWLLVSGLIGLTVGDSLLFAAINRIGPRRALLITISSAPVTAILAMPILSEWLGPLAWLGIALTVAGVLWVINERATRMRSIEDKSGIIFAVAAALCQAGGNIATKLGAEGVQPMWMATIRLSAGTLGLLALLLLRAQLPSIIDALRVPRRAAGVFVAAVIGTYLGIWLQVAGIANTDTGVAATLSSTSPILVLPLARYWLKDHTSLRAVLGALAAVCGIALLFA